MKKIIALSAALSLMIIISAIAQKLPNVQEKSLRAPATIKVDGKPTEWNNQLQAYNKTTEVFYTLSNNNDKLYLTVQASNLDIINKIVCGGVTLTINGSGKMKDQGGVSITYPLVEIVPKFNAPPITFKQIPQVIEDNEPNRILLDSFMVFFNKKFAEKAKDIRVEGVDKIPNHLISIYNPEGIKAAALIDNRRLFTLEMAVPLKYLGSVVNAAKPFNYSIKLSGMNADLSSMNSVGNAMFTLRGEIFKGGRDAITAFNMINGAFVFDGPIVPRIKDLITPSSLWGEYTLAK
jgi:hypothetical protein